MKILRIGILNLNSLRGEQTVDFVDGPLANHQLYAIVGPTGAGKTTILDAITLALYGQTERNKSEKDRKDGSGSVMTYGEGECRAELEYETARGRYRNVWARQRAHKKPDANLTASRREINKWDPETESWSILATKKREVDALTEEVVGLDYERFVRSVMLTQGDFARFLKSDPGDKAAILEKITGTEVYQEISIAAFARAKYIREDWERATAALTTNLPYTKEEREELDRQTKDQKTKILPLRKALALVVSQLGLHDNLRALNVKLAANQAAQEALEKSWLAFNDDRERLTKSDALQPLRPDLDTELRLATEDKKLTAAIAEADEQAGLLETGLVTAKSAVVTVQEKLNEYYEKLPGREKKFAAVAELEREITGLNRDIDLDRKRKESTENGLGERRAKGRELAKAVAAIRKELAGMEPSAIQQRLTELEGSIPPFAPLIESLRQRINQRQLQDRLARESALARQMGEELRVAVTAVEKAKQNLAEADVALKDRLAISTNLRLSQSLAAHKTNLEPGEECPICGATEHPGLEDFVPVTDTAIQRAKEDANRALTAQETAKRTLDAVQSKEVVLRRKHDGQLALTEELSKQLGPDHQPEMETVDQLTKQRESATAQLAKDTAEQTRLRRLQTNLPRLTALETELTGVNQRITELETELKAVDEALTKATTAVGKKREKIKAEVGERTAEECRELTRQQKEKLTARLSAAEKAEVDAKGKKASLASRRSVLVERHATVLAELKAVRDRLAKQLGPQEITVAGARAALLSENETSHLRQRQNELATRRATATTVGKSLAEEMTAATTAIKDVPDREALEKDRSEREFTVSEADRLIGALELQVRQDDERIAAVAEQQKSIEGLRLETDRWQRLSDLIGSADGKKFRSYAQAITLQQLIAIGNDHLQSINPRYRMEYEAPEAGAPERLEMIITDRYQNDNRRTMATLSGGESFLISLALALGLSDLASGKSLIQSLFIDEGFGTLDGKTLDQAMTTLEQLQAQGKTIGLISHVPALKERIYCQLELVRVGDGYSRIEVRG